MRSRTEDLDLEWRETIAEQRIPLRVAVLCSHRAPGSAYLLRARAPIAACCMTSSACMSERGEIRRRRGDDLARDSTASSIRSAAFCAGARHRVDDLAACGRCMTRRRSSGFGVPPDSRRARQLSVSPTRRDAAALPTAASSTCITVISCGVDADGRPRYPGLRAVRDAIVAGETATRATVAPGHARARRADRRCCDRGHFRCRRSRSTRSAGSAPTCSRRTSSPTRNG